MHLRPGPSQKPQYLVNLIQLLTVEVLSYFMWTWSKAWCNIFAIYYAYVNTLWLTRISCICLGHHASCTSCMSSKKTKMQCIGVLFVCVAKF